MAKDSQVNGFFNFDNGAVTANSVQLSPTPNEQVAGISEEIKQAKEDLPVENLYGKESKIGYTAPIESGKPTVKEIAGGIKVYLRPGQTLEKGDSESKQIDATDCNQLNAVNAPKQMQSNAEKVNKSSASGGSKTSLKGLVDLKECIFDNDSLFWRGVISNRRIQKFMDCGQEKADEYIDALKGENVLNADGQKSSNEMQSQNNAGD